MARSAILRRTFTGAWIETSATQYLTIHANVAPSRVRGLKPRDVYQDFDMVAVAPSRVRGLKLS